MKFDEDLAAIHGYLCGDGYVIKNPNTQKHKYYHIGFRNINEAILKDFQSKFTKFFGITPIITNESRCRIQNKEIYMLLTNDFSYYSYKWELPKLSRKCLKFWLRAFFDCEGWVENQPAKSRLIGLDCCNEFGLYSVQKALDKLNISSQIKKRKNKTIWRLTICGMVTLKKFQKSIGFLHPEKKAKLKEAINSYVNYDWFLPDSKKELFKFVKKKGKLRKSKDELIFISIKKKNLRNLKKALNKYQIKSKLFGPWKSSTSSKYYSLVIKKEVLENERNKIRTAARD
ncbi:MAG: LAGLIDADG family homing endonuclease [Nanoarchaeota archaeon]|nr:hypothetical protein [Nanoarchaeota archaeon]MBU1631910.1 hypothetical protein [Nanoarchaeota archaeon]MBU1876603.1 hypothetical protein [Nanoarchaeota archaeon]